MDEDDNDDDFSYVSDDDIDDSEGRVMSNAVSRWKSIRNTGRKKHGKFLYLELNVDIFDTTPRKSNGIDEINEVMEFLRSHGTTRSFIAPFIEQLQELMKTKQRFIIHWTERFFDHLLPIISRDMSGVFLPMLNYSIDTAEFSIDMNIPWFINQLGNYLLSDGEIYDRLKFTRLLQHIAGMDDDDKGSAVKRDKRTRKWFVNRGNNSDDDDDDADDDDDLIKSHHNKANDTSKRKTTAKKNSLSADGTAVGETFARASLLNEDGIKGVSPLDEDGIKVVEVRLPGLKSTDDEKQDAKPATMDVESGIPSSGRTMLKFYYKGIVYFFWIVVPDEVWRVLSFDEKTQIYESAVKVGESWDDLMLCWWKLQRIMFYHPKMKFCWVCVGLPLGLESFVIEHSVHFIHPKLYAGGEFFGEGIRDYIDQLCTLLEAHIIFAGTYDSAEYHRQNNFSIYNNDNVPGYLYAAARHIDVDLRTRIINSMKTCGDNHTVINYLMHLLTDTKIGYTTLRYQRFQHMSWANSCKDFDTLLTNNTIDNARQMEDNLHTQLNPQRLLGVGIGEFFTFMTGVREVEAVMNNFLANNCTPNDTVVNYRLLRRKNGQLYCTTLVLEFIRLKLITLDEVEILLKHEYYAVLKGRGYDNDNIGGEDR